MSILAEEKALYVVNEPDTETEVSFKNPVRELGFAQIEHIVGLDVTLSDGAYRTLAILHYFWQQKKSAYPGLDTLAKLRGKSERTVSEHLAELTEKGIISRSRRMGTSSMTYLEDLPQEYADAATAILTERMRKTARKTGRKLPVEAEENFQQRITREEEQVVGNTTPPNGKEPIEQASPPEKLIEHTIFGLSWRDRQEIREIAEKDVGLVSLKQALQELRAKVGTGEYRATWGTLRKFWNNTLSTNVLRGAGPPALAEMPEYQKHITWET